MGGPNVKAVLRGTLGEITRVQTVHVSSPDVPWHLDMHTESRRCRVRLRMQRPCVSMILNEPYGVYIYICI